MVELVAMHGAAFAGRELELPHPHTIVFEDDLRTDSTEYTIPVHSRAR